MNLLSTFVDTLSREGTALHIFGEHSVRAVHAEDAIVGGRTVALSEDPLYQILVLVFLFFYFVWIYGYFNKRGFKSFVGTASAFDTNREEGVHTGASRRRVGDVALLWSLIIGVFLLFVTKVVEVTEGVAFALFPHLVDGEGVTMQISQVGLDRWMMTIVIGFFGSMLWSIGALYIADRLSRSGTILRAILELRSKMLLYSVIYLMPCVLLCAFGAYDSLRFYLALIMVVIFTLGYLIRSFLLFQSKKISILLWILYLCTVEIFPATLVWSIFTRS